MPRRKPFKFKHYCYTGKGDAVEVVRGVLGLPEDTDINENAAAMEIYNEVRKPVALEFEMDPKTNVVKLVGFGREH